MKNIFLLLLSLCLIGCSLDSKTLSQLSGLLPAKGNLRLLATDAPFNYGEVTSAKVNVTRIELSHSSSGSTVTLLDSPRPLDLVILKNGLVETLADLDVPPGEYDQVRIYADTASITLSDGSTPSLDVPAALSSGVKIPIAPAILVTGELSTDVLLDFDLSRSFVQTGSTPADGFVFRPVIRTSNLTTARTLEGKVENVEGKSLEGAIVTVSDESGVVATAVTESNGTYKILGLQEGEYFVVASLAEYQTSVSHLMTTVKAGNETTEDFTLEAAL